MKRLLCLGAIFALSTLALAKPSTNTDFGGASGSPISVATGTRIEYYSARQVMVTPDGTFAVCQHPNHPEPYTIDTCRTPGSKDKADKWTPLGKLMLNGFKLRSVQVNETRGGPSLIVVWDLMPNTPTPPK